MAGIDKVLVTAFGVLGIIFVYWFFLMRKQKEAMAAQSVDVIVEGGYSPEVIVVPKNKTTKINFIRKGRSSCLEEVVLSDFKVRKFLPLNQKVSFEITPNKSGEYPFSCGMNMFHGKVIVK